MTTVSPRSPAPRKRTAGGIPDAGQIDPGRSGYNVCLRSRSQTRNWIEYGAARLVVGCVGLLPWRVAFALSCWIQVLVRRLVPRWRKTACRNLELALPELSAGERERIADGVFLSLARLIATVAKFPQINRENISRWIRYEGFEHFEAALARGRGVLFATAHMGNWEFSAFAHALMTAPMHVVVRPLDNPLLDNWVTRQRTRAGNRVIGKKDFSRSILKALRANEAVGILIDHNTGLDEGIFVDFFGVPACSSPLFAKLAARTGAAVLPGFAVWREDEQRYVLRFYPLVEITGDEVEDTRRCQRAVEQAVREYPDQWLWIHRRWKTRPPGEPPLY
jgi:Kdo2-lipid IVA lauroyltransferase/acyltransferase